MDTAIKFGAGRYRQDKNILEICGEEISRFGKKAFVIAGKTAFEKTKERLLLGFEKVGLDYEIAIYQGVCSYEGARMLADQCLKAGCDEIVGLGGGIVMDISKAAAEYAGVGVVNIPTSIATCAAFTCCSVMYTSDGKKKDAWRYDHELDAVLVDMDVIANCPPRFAAAGILDAMAKKIEIQNGKPRMLLEDFKIDLFSAYKMAEFTYDILYYNGQKAIEDIKKGMVSKAVYDVTFINIAVTGVLANITQSFHQSALGHVIYDGVRTYFTKEAKDYLHGEIVAVALFTQLYYNLLPQDKEALKDYMRNMDMPLSLGELGIETSEENLKILEDYLIDSPYIENTSESLSLLHDAMKQMV